MTENEEENKMEIKDTEEISEESDEESDVDKPKEPEVENKQKEAIEEEIAEKKSDKKRKVRRKVKTKKVIRKRKSKKEKENPIVQALRLAVETGKVEFGAKTGVKDALLSKAKLIVVASNAPNELQEDVSYYSKLSNIPLFVFIGTSKELGSICGKPYTVSVLSIYDVGNSNIMEIATKK